MQIDVREASLLNLERCSAQLVLLLQPDDEPVTRGLAAIIDWQTEGCVSQMLINRSATPSSPLRASWIALERRRLRVHNLVLLTWSRQGLAAGHSSARALGAELAIAQLIADLRTPSVLAVPSLGLPENLRIHLVFKPAARARAERLIVLTPLDELADWCSTQSSLGQLISRSRGS